MTEKNTKTFELRLLPIELHQAIKNAATLEDISMNKWILRALQQQVDQTTPNSKRLY